MDKLSFDYNLRLFKGEIIQIYLIITALILHFHWHQLMMNTWCIDSFFDILIEPNQSTDDLLTPPDKRLKRVFFCRFSS